MSTKAKIIIVIAILLILGVIAYFIFFRKPKELPAPTIMPTPLPDLKVLDTFPLHIGEQGSNVKRLQMALNRLDTTKKLADLLVDGVFGDKTRTKLMTVLSTSQYSANQTVTEDQLRQLFAQKGEVTSVKIIVDKFTGEKRGFGFVDMPNQAEAQQAIAELNNYELERQTLRVNEARAPEARGPRPGGDRFGSGGNGGGDRGRGGSSGGWGSRPKRF